MAVLDLTPDPAALTTADELADLQRRQRAALWTGRGWGDHTFE
jgi:hypothetical protein